MHVRKAVLYLIPIFLCCGISFFLYLDASRSDTDQSVEQLLDRLTRDYGVSREVIDEHAARFSSRAEADQLALELLEGHKHEQPSRFQVFDTGVELVFAHLGSGSIGSTGRFLEFAIVLINDSNRPSQGTIRFFNDQGAPMAVPFDGEEVTEIGFDLAIGEVRRFVSDGPGPVRSGWALVHSDQPVSGTLSFGVRDEQGRVFTDVGVPPSPVAPEFMIFADTLADSDTGVGLSNPQNQPVDLEFELRNSSGDTVATEVRQLPPLGHLALFVTQLFNNMPGIDEFEGSVVIRSRGSSAQEIGMAQGETEPALPSFSGVTLRTTGAQLTSLPTVELPPPDANWTTLVFPHMAVGEAAGLGILTSTILYNNTALPTSGTVEYFSSEGTAIEVLVDGEMTTTVSFDLEAGGVGRTLARSPGGIDTGWIRVNMDQPIAGTNLFTIFDTGGTVRAEVGIPSAILQKDFNLIADSTGPFNTAIALAFALAREEEVERSEEQVSVDLTLRDSDGRFVANTDVDLSALAHEALFLTELFPDVDGIEEFQGYIQGSSGEFVGVVSLRSAGVRLTSVPLFDKLRGFGPVSTFEPTQNLTGTAPALQWTLHQGRDDLALDSLTIRFHGAALMENTVQPGDQFALGTFLQPTLSESRIFRLIAREISSVAFDLVSVREEGLIPQGRGRISEDAEGVQIELELDGDPNTFIGGDSDWTFFLPSNLVQLPGDDEELSIDTEFLSVPSFKIADNRITRRTNQVLELQNADDFALQVHSVSPSFLIPGEELTISGHGFGADTRLEIDSGETALELLPLARTESNLETQAPAGLRPLLIRAVEGGIRSNALEVFTLFSPSFSTSLADDDPETEVDESGFSFETLLPVGDLMLRSQEITLPGIDVDLSSLVVDQQVGAVELEGFSDSSLFVVEILEDRVVLEAKQGLDAGSSATVTLSRDENAPESLVIHFEPASPPAEPRLVLRDYRLLLTLFDSFFPRESGLLLGNVVVGSAPLFSGDSGPGYEVSDVVVILGEESL